MAEVDGYFIYYEKNVNMHEYMLANKVVEYTAKPPTLVERIPITYAGEEETQEESTPKEDTHAFSYSESMEPEDVIRRHQADKARRKVPQAEQRRALNMVASLCAVLFIVSFVMGVALIRNQDSISQLEHEISVLTIGYRDLLAIMEAPAFAGQEQPSVQQNDIPVDLPRVEPTDPPEESAQEAATQAETTPEPTPPEADAYQPDENIDTAPVFAVIPETYTIQYGDSLIAISRRFFGGDDMVEEIMALNGIYNPDHIVAGRTIALPRR